MLVDLSGKFLPNLTEIGERTFQRSPSPESTESSPPSRVPESPAALYARHRLWEVSDLVALLAASLKISRPNSKYGLLALLESTGHFRS